MSLNSPSCSRLVITLLEQTLHTGEGRCFCLRGTCAWLFSPSSSLPLWRHFCVPLPQSMRNSKLPSSLCLPAWEPISVYSSPKPLLPAQFPPRQHPTVNSSLSSESLTVTMWKVSPLPVLSPESIPVAIHKVAFGFLPSSFYGRPFNPYSCSPWLITYNKPHSGNVNGNSQVIQITQMLTIHHR